MKQDVGELHLGLLETLINIFHNILTFHRQKNELFYQINHAVITCTHSKVWSHSRGANLGLELPSVLFFQLNTMAADFIQYPVNNQSAEGLISENSWCLIGLKTFSGVQEAA